MQTWISLFPILVVAKISGSLTTIQMVPIPRNMSSVPHPPSPPTSPPCGSHYPRLANFAQCSDLMNYFWKIECNKKLVCLNLRSLNKSNFEWKGYGYFKSQWESKSSQFLFSASSNKDSRSHPYYFSEMREGWGHGKVAWFIVLSHLPPSIDKSGCFIDFHHPLRPLCWCFETFIQFQETDGTSFHFWIICYTFLKWNGQL